MVKRIVTFALYQPLFLVLMVALFIAGGIVAFRVSHCCRIRLRLGGEGAGHGCK